MNNDTLWNIFLIVSVILIINGMGNIGDSDKKTAQAAQGESSIGAGGLAAFIMKKTNPWLIFLAVSASLPFVFSQWKNLFAPSPAIPGWVWIGAFLVIMLLILRRGK